MPGVTLEASVADRGRGVLGRRQQLRSGLAACLAGFLGVAGPVGSAPRAEAGLSRPTLAVLNDQWASQAKEVELVDLAGHIDRIAPHSPLPGDGAWSPDAKSIAFSGRMTDAGKHYRGLYVMDVRTRRARLIYAAPKSAFPYEPVWSPDGRRLAFFVDGRGPWVIGVNGRALRRLADLAGEMPGGLAWSRSGRLLAVAGRNGVDEALYTVRTRGRPRLRRLTRRQTRKERTNEAGVAWPSWSPDDRRLVFERFDFEHPPEVDVVGADGRGERRVARGESPVWSPRGAQIAFVADGPELDEDAAGVRVGIAVVSPRGRPRRVANPPGGEWELAWTRDGNELAVASGERGIYLLALNGRIHRAAVKEARWLRLSPPPDQKWSPAGMLLEVSAADAYGNVTGVRLRNLRGAVVASYRRVIDSSPTWSPDGRKLAFVRTSTLPQLYVVDTARSTLRRLASGRYPVWSPNRKWLAFQRGKRAFVMPASGGRARAVAIGRPATWSPDSERLAIVGAGLFTLHLGDWTLTRLDRPFESCGFISKVTSAAWSHDGRSIAFEAEDLDCDLSVVAVVTADGATQRVVAHVVDSPQWSPDDSVLYFRHYLGALERARPDGSDVQTIRASGVVSYALFPRGKLIAYATSDAVAVSDANGRGWHTVRRTGADANPVWRP
jgi:Tol biopolymer transport system component